MKLWILLVEVSSSFSAWKKCGILLPEVDSYKVVEGIVHIDREVLDAFS